MSYLEEIKRSLGIHESIKVYDEELNTLIEDAKGELEEAGIKEEYIREEDKRIVTCVQLYCKMNFANDRSDTMTYKEMYERKLTRLANTCRGG